MSKKEKNIQLISNKNLDKTKKNNYSVGITENHCGIS
jgi:hypothetical protein